MALFTKIAAIAEARPSFFGSASATGPQPHALKLRAGEQVFGEGDQSLHLYEVRDGVLKLYKILADGRCQIIGFAYPGQLIGLALGGRHVYSADAVTAAVVLSCSRNRVEARLHTRGLPTSSGPRRPTNSLPPGNRC